jgi:ribosomal-protein-alanine N-acetyltransferase
VPTPLPLFPDIHTTRLVVRALAWLGRTHWRQGYAAEALRAVCRHAFEAAGIRRIEAEARPDNVASNELLLSLGFIHEGRLRQRWVSKGESYDTNVYGLLVDDWRKHNAGEVT